MCRLGQMFNQVGTSGCAIGIQLRQAHGFQNAFHNFPAFLFQGAGYPSGSSSVSVSVVRKRWPVEIPSRPAAVVGCHVCPQVPYRPAAKLHELRLLSHPADIVQETMIRLTRLNRVPLVLNSDLIEHIDVTPDTVITLTTGQILRVRETAEEVVRRIIEFRRRIFGPESDLILPPMEPEEPTGQG